MLVPRIETDRLRLRGHRPEDASACAAMWADPAVVRYILGTAATPSPAAARVAAWRRLLVYAGLWTHLGYGYWAIEERATGAFVGEVGVADFRREPALAPPGEPEFGWVLATAFHGRGYAREATLAIAAWVDATVEAPRTVCAIDAANAASLRLAHGLGFEPIAGYDNETYRAFARRRHGGSP